jgi:hypothetical protein
MSSKWIDRELFTKYQDEKEQEQAQASTLGIRKSDVVWPTPPAGSTTKPEVYEGRMLPDKRGNFTKRYFYHMWRTGDKWNFVFCPKTGDFNNWCPVCSVTSKLYLGNVKDKQAARNYKRKERHITNFFVIDDPRDAKIDEADKKMAGQVKIYEFPNKVESKIRNEILDKKQGLGYAIFDPGEDGFNLILKIKSTKPDENQKSYPDYSDSQFSRKPSAIGTEKEIKVIMEKTYDLDEYLKGQETPDDDIKTILKNEMLWEMVQDEWSKLKGNGNGKEKKVVTIPSVNTEDAEPDVSEDILDSDDDLLKELENMK